MKTVGNQSMQKKKEEEEEQNSIKGHWLDE